jgi:hypothetical protein
MGIGGEGRGEVGFSCFVSKYAFLFASTPLPNPLPALRWRGEGIGATGSPRLRQADVATKFLKLFQALHRVENFRKIFRCGFNGRKSATIFRKRPTAGENLFCDSFQRYEKKSWIYVD